MTFKVKDDDNVKILNLIVWAVPSHFNRDNNEIF